MKIAVKEINLALLKWALQYNPSVALSLKNTPNIQTTTNRTHSIIYIGYTREFS